MRFLVVIFFFACAYAQNDLESGNGICSLCVQKNLVGDCCVGNTKCESVDGTIDCIQTIPSRDDFPAAKKEFSNQLYEMNGKDFCSICCGLDSSFSQCCSGLKSCVCTKSLQPSCV